MRASRGTGSVRLRRVMRWCFLDGGGRRIAAGACTAAAAALAPLAAGAQIPDFPTLSGAGLEYVSESGLFQITLSGQLDLEPIFVDASWAGLINHAGGEDPLPASRVPCAACHVRMGIRGDGGAIRTHRLRVFADVFLGDHVYSLVEVRNDRGNAPSDGPVQTRVEQAYLRLTTTSGSLGAQAGRFASPFGSYPMRHLSTEDPFLRPPLGYDYRTIMSRTIVGQTNARFLRWKDATDFLRKDGVPPVWDVPYPWGAMAFSALGPFFFRVAAVNSAPSSGPAAWAFDEDRLRDPSWVASVRWTPTSALDIGASYNRGPWMEATIADAILADPGAPPGTPPPGFRDFDQELASLDFAYARGPVTLRGEAILDRWSLANMEDRPEEVSYSVEMQWDLVAGLYVAARYGHIDFRPMSDGLGDASPLPGGMEDWDYDVRRYEGSVGYRLARNVGVLLSAYEQRQRVLDDGDVRFAGLRVWWAF